MKNYLYLGTIVLLLVGGFFYIKLEKQSYKDEIKTIEEENELLKQQIIDLRLQNTLKLDTLQRNIIARDQVIQELYKSSNKFIKIYEKFKTTKPNYNDSVLLESLKRILNVEINE